MEDQAKYEVYEAAALFFDGSARQHPVPGTVARDEPELWAELRTRPPLTSALLERGGRALRHLLRAMPGARG